MKNTLVILLASFCSMLSFGQSNIFEQLEKHQGEQYKKFRINYSPSEKRLKFDDRFSNDPYNKVVIFIQRNNAGRPMNLEIQNVSSSNSPSKYSPTFRHTVYDHYTQPSFIGSSLNGKDTYVTVDGILFEIKKANANMTSYGDRGGYGFAYVPMSIAKNKAGDEKGKNPKKKLSFKEKMKAKLNKLSLDNLIGRPSVFKELNSREAFETYINSYLKSMKAKQAKFPLTAQDKKEIAAMKSGAEMEKANINKANKDYWNSEEGQRVLAKGNNNKKGNKYYVKNTGANTIEVGGNGYTYSISPGSTKEFICDKAIFYKVKEGSSWKTGSQISDGKNVCGKTLTIQ